MAKTSKQRAIQPVAEPIKLGRKTTPAAVRFAGLCREELNENGCHEFLGFRNKAGYATFYKSSTEMVLAHRFALELAGIVIPPGSVGMHLCQNPACIRVDKDHVQPGTSSENAQDREARGRRRAPKGPFKPDLDYETAQVIRSLSKQGVPGYKLAAAFDRQPITISRILNNKSYVKPRPKPSIPGPQKGLGASSRKKGSRSTPAIQKAA